MIHCRGRVNLPDYILKNVFVYVFGRIQSAPTVGIMYYNKLLI